MTIELDSTLAQAEVLFLSFAQLIADIDRRKAEEISASSSNLRRRATLGSKSAGSISSIEGAEAEKKAVVQVDDLLMFRQLSKKASDEGIDVGSLYLPLRQSC